MVSAGPSPCRESSSENPLDALDGGFRFDSSAQLSQVMFPVAGALVISSSLLAVVVVTSHFWGEVGLFPSKTEVTWL